MYVPKEEKVYLANMAHREALGLDVVVLQHRRRASAIIKREEAPGGGGGGGGGGSLSPPRARRKARKIAPATAAIALEGAWHPSTIDMPAPKGFSQAGGGGREDQLPPLVQVHHHHHHHPHHHSAREGQKGQKRGSGRRVSLPTI